MANAEPPAPAGRIHAAFYGRVVRDVDPEVSIQRQLAAAAIALADIPITGFFADVAPWSGLHGSTHPTDTWRLNGHPVDGGVLDLLDRARRPEPRLDLVVCADLERLSRRLVDRVRIEGLLADCGVRIVTPADPYIPTDPIPARVTRVVRRQVIGCEHSGQRSW
jgi:hypothetical protein